MESDLTPKFAPFFGMVRLSYTCRSSTEPKLTLSRAGLPSR